MEKLPTTALFLQINRALKAMVALYVTFCFVSTEAFAQEQQQGQTTQDATESAQNSSEPLAGQLFHRSPNRARHPENADGQPYHHANAWKTGYTQTTPAAPYPYPAPGQSDYANSSQNGRHSQSTAQRTLMNKSQEANTNHGSTNSGGGAQTLSWNWQYGQAMPDTRPNQDTAPSSSGTASNASGERALESPSNEQMPYAQCQNSYTQAQPVAQPSMTAYEMQEQALRQSQYLNREPYPPSDPISAYQPSPTPTASGGGGGGAVGFLGRFARQTAMTCLPIAVGALAITGLTRASTGASGMMPGMQGMPASMPLGASRIAGSGISRLINAFK
jgi:hypothetical protein